MVLSGNKEGRHSETEIAIFLIKGDCQGKRVSEKECPVVMGKRDNHSGAIIRPVMCATQIMDQAFPV